MENKNELTKEKFIEGLNYCANNADACACDNCPIEESCGGYACAIAAIALSFLKEWKELVSEPTATTSEVSNNTSDLTFQKNLQNKLDNVCGDIVTIYDGFSAKEQKAFDLGDIYRQVIDIMVK